MKISSSVNVLSYSSPDLARTFIKSNNIAGAFVWREGKRHYQVMEGKPEELTGFVAAEFTTMKEANELAGKINERIKELTN